MSEGELVYARPFPRWAKVAVMALPFLALVPIAIFTVWREPIFSMHRSLEKVVGLPAVMGGMITIMASPAIVFMALMIWARRSYGRCTLAKDQATFEIALAPRVAGTVAVPFADIESRTVTPRGMLVGVRKRGGWTAFVFPLLIPTSSDEEIARVVALLDAREPLPDRTPDFTCGETRLARIGWVVLAALVAGSLAPAAITYTRVSSVAFSLAELPFFVTAAALWFLLWLAEKKTTFLTTRRLHVGDGAVLVGAKRIAYSELTLAAGAEGTLALAWGKKRMLVGVGLDLERALAALEEKLRSARPELRVARELPAWATPARQRRTAVLLAALGLVVVLGVVALVSLPRAVYGAAVARLDLVDDVACSDLCGQSLRLVYRLGDDEPRFLVLQTGTVRAFNYRNETIHVPGPPWTIGDGKEVELDLVRGRGHDHAGAELTFPPGTTVVHLLEGRHVFSSAALPPELVTAASTVHRSYDRSLPEMLEAHLPRPTGVAALDDFLDGRTSRRCFDLEDRAGDRLVAGVDQGAVELVAVLPAARGVKLVASYRHEVKGPSPFTLSGANVDLYWVDANEALQSAKGAMPSLDELLSMIAKVREGRPAKEVAKSLLAAASAK